MEQEDTVVEFEDDNPVAVQVATPGGSSGTFELTVHVKEALPDKAIGTAYSGDIGLADVSVTLVPVGPGGHYPGAITSTSMSWSGYDATKAVTFQFNGVEVNTHTAEVTVNGDYYVGN